ncbi:MAG: hypothetical protein IJ106_00475 [Parasporobacterium sp.]|nr:hypothetical protein [Parasporobacterium sp.]
MNENPIPAGHFRDLAERSFRQNIYTFTEFLGDAQIGLLMNLEKELSYAGITLFGGTEHAGRVIARFGRAADLGYEAEFPIVCLEITPLSEKFSEELNHRDYLGALMNLGIRRELLGDILVQDKKAYLFCLDHIADYIKGSLTQVRHTRVRVTRPDKIPEEAAVKLEPQPVIVSSERADAVISKFCNLSRSQSQNLFREGKILINGQECGDGSHLLKKEDRVSVRGFGKFLYSGAVGTTGKGRIRVLLQRFC